MRRLGGRVAKVKFERAGAEASPIGDEENQACTPETVLEGQNFDHGESSRAGEQHAAESSRVMGPLKRGSAASAILSNRHLLFGRCGVFAFAFRPLFHLSGRLIKR